MSRPLLKWAGGKRKLAPFILEQLKYTANVDTYVEPFLGAGACLCAVAGDSEFDHLQLLGADSSPFVRLWWDSLVHCDPDELHSVLVDIPTWERKLYSAARVVVSDWTKKHPALVGADYAIMVATLYWVNKGGYNGLCRFNSSGGYNVPLDMRRLGKRPTWEHDSVRFHVQLAQRLRESGVRAGHSTLPQDWATVLAGVSADDRAFVYCDPPFLDSFTGYGTIKWTGLDLHNLAHMLGDAPSTWTVLISEHADGDAPLILAEYGFAPVHTWGRSGQMNSDGAARGKVTEAVYGRVR